MASEKFRLELAKAILAKKSFDGQLTPTFRGVSIDKFDDEERIKICCLFHELSEKAQNLVNDFLEREI